MTTGSFPALKWPGHGIDHPTPSSARVKETVELYVYFPCGPSGHILGWTLLYFYTYTEMYTTFQHNHHFYWGIHPSGTHWCTSQWNLCQLSRAWSQMTNPTAKDFFERSIKLKSKGISLVCAKNSETPPIHTAWSTAWSSGLCGVSQCHGWQWWWCQGWTILVSFFKKSSHSVQCVAATPIVSHLGRKMALSKVSCWDSDQLPPCTFFVKRFDSLVSHCEKHLESVIVLKSGVHVCKC